MEGGEREREREESSEVIIVSEEVFTIGGRFSSTYLPVGAKHLCIKHQLYIFI